MITTQPVRDLAEQLAQSGQLPAYVYDLDHLRAHVAKIRSALSVSPNVEFFYAAKANPAENLLTTIEPFVDGFDVSSGGELEHVRKTVPGARLVLSGPGKTDAELRLAVDEADRVHVESAFELQRLADAARAAGREVSVLLRVNLALDREGAALSMSGPFGMAPESIDACRAIFEAEPYVRLRGIHAHLASGLDAGTMLKVADHILAWARPWLSGVEAPEINLGGGMGVDYRAPNQLFDWETYGQGLAERVRDGETLRIEPGRSITVYSGWYVTDVLDIKQNHGEWFAILRGGTHHIRTPVTKGHDQPFEVIAMRWPGVPTTSGQAITLVGQLCTPKDVFARQIPIGQLTVGDVIAFEMSGAYAWNISHHDFLMHPKPSFHYLAR